MTVIFDFDGVMIQSDQCWEEDKPRVFEEVYGANIAQRLRRTSGLSMDQIHALAVSHGSPASIQTMYNACDREASHIYAKALLTIGLEETLQELNTRKLKLGIVSASPKSWIDITLKRLVHPEYFSVVLSLHDRKDLAHKPAPDGYIEAIRALGSTPGETIVIEDSNTGITSAKAAGAYVVGLRQNLIPGYTIEGADTYIDLISHIAPFIKGVKV